MNTYDTLYKKNLQAFVEARAGREQEVQQFADGVERVLQARPDFFKGRVDLPEKISLKVLVPELYKEQPDSEECIRQQENVIKLMEEVNRVYLEEMEAANRCLLDYQPLASNVQ